MKDLVIKLTNVSKKYRISRYKPTLVGKVLRKKTPRRAFFALKNVNLEVRRGERIGIVGPNGAGKTTLLKIIDRITKPSMGKVSSKGKVVALLDLEAGFHPDLSGIENIMFNGLLIGVKKKDIKKREQEIIKFADIGKFIYEPYYTYSAGMKFRLAFAVALTSRCDILIIDEIFIAGDFDFQSKTMEKLMETQKSRKITTIISSHFPGFIWAFSDIFYKIEHGVMRKCSNKEIVKIIRKDEKVTRETFNFLKRKKINTTLEVGLGFGFSAAYIMLAIPTKSTHTAIDPFQGDEFYNNIGLKNIQKFPFGNKLKLIKDYSYKALPKLLNKGSKFDFAFIDGDHKFDSIFVEFFYIDLILNKGGYIVFHDAWMRSTQMVAAWIKANKGNYRICNTNITNFLIFRKVGVDRRDWYSYNEFFTFKGFLENFYFKLTGKSPY